MIHAEAEVSFPFWHRARTPLWGVGEGTASKPPAPRQQCSCFARGPRECTSIPHTPNETALSFEVRGIAAEGMPGRFAWNAVGSNIRELPTHQSLGVVKGPSVMRSQFWEGLKMGPADP